MPWQVGHAGNEVDSSQNVFIWSNIHHCSSSTTLCAIGQIVVLKTENKTDFTEGVVNY
jgi:hypothetical protein